MIVQVKTYDTAECDEAINNKHMDEQELMYELFMSNDDECRLCFTNLTKYPLKSNVLLSLEIFKTCKLDHDILYERHHKVNYYAHPLHPVQ
ncbi:hypothetical protein PFDG_05332, partial [Plasmodium falciparum Dd2]